MEEHKKIIERLECLSVGERTALRRMAGKPLTMVDGQALQALFQALPPGTLPREWEQKLWLTALSIACLWDVEETQEGQSMTQMLRNYNANDQMNGMDSRMRSLLDANLDKDGYLAGKLAWLARMLRADDRQTMSVCAVPQRGREDSLSCAGRRRAAPTVPDQRRKARFFLGGLALPGSRTHDRRSFRWRSTNLRRAKYSFLIC